MPEPIRCGRRIVVVLCRVCRDLLKKTFPKNLFPHVSLFGVLAGSMEEAHVSYPLARSKICDGDLLLFRPRRGVLGRSIAKAGRSDYSHAGMAAWWNGRLMCLDMVQGHGGQAVLLSNLVQKHPGRIDVYSAGANGKPFDRHAAIEAMIEITGQPCRW